MERVKVGLVGFGTVGGGFYRLLRDNGELFAKKLGIPVEISLVAEKLPEKVRETAPSQAVTGDYTRIVADPEIRVVVELVGGTGVAYQVIRSALEAGKHVITANKALLALRGAELFGIAARHGVALMFEASVGGGIPIIKVVRESLVGNRIRRLLGVLNGTSNYILTRMSEEGMSFGEALGEAQQRGFAEADPTLDVGGGDSAHKISLLAGLAFGGWVDYREILCEGITGITPGEIEFAASAGFVFKLVASAALMEGRVAAGVFPALLPREHPLAAVRNEINAVYVEGDFLGPSVYEGRGAGAEATASSVASDLGDLVRMMRLCGAAAVQKPGGAIAESPAPLPLYPQPEIEHRYFFHFITENRPGIWATVTGKLAENGINIESVHQRWEDRSKPSDLYVMVDPAPERQARKALEEICASSGISESSRFYRILIN